MSHKPTLKQANSKYVLLTSLKKGEQKCLTKQHHKRIRDIPQKPTLIQLNQRHAPDMYSAYET